MYVSNIISVYSISYIKNITSLGEEILSSGERLAAYQRFCESEIAKKHRQEEEFSDLVLMGTSATKQGDYQN